MITIIELVMPFHLGMVNSYLVQSGSKFLLIDTGSSSARKQLLQQLQNTGCMPGSLSLVVLTHGDFDHTGNAAFLREDFHCPLAMHAGDRAMAEQGDMFAGRKQPSWLLKKVLPALSGFGTKERFTPDVLLQEGMSLKKFGFDAEVISLPGHSLGSIGILMNSGELFCGDLFENLKKPVLGSIMDDQTKARSSAERLKKIKVTTVYPGHGKPFSIKGFFRSTVE